jgi:drug/metabolite transporter (DMT)-like permease
MPASDHLKGIAITAAGITVLSLDAPLIRLIEADGVTVAVWRGLLMTLGLVVLALAIAPRRFPRDLRSLSPADVFAAACLATGNLCFVLAAKLIPVANLLLIVAIVPLMTALTARILLGERLSRSTAIGIGGAILGIAVLVSGDLSLSGNLLGHLVAFGVTIVTGLFFTLLRKGRARSPAPVLVVSGLILGIGMLPVAWPAHVPDASLPWMLLLGLGVMPVAWIMISQGPRYLPAAEASFLMLLETVLGPVWAWLILAELPTDRAFVGGAIVLASVAWHVLAGRRHARRVHHDLY